MKKGVLGLVLGLFVLALCLSFVNAAGTLYRIDFAQSGGDTSQEGGPMQNDSTTDATTTAADANFGTDGSDIWNRFTSDAAVGSGANATTQFTFGSANNLTSSTGATGVASLTFFNTTSSNGNGQGTFLRGGYFAYDNIQNAQFRVNLGAGAAGASVTLALYAFVNGTPGDYSFDNQFGSESGTITNNASSLLLLHATANGSGQVDGLFNTNGINGGVTIAGMQIFETPDAIPPVVAISTTDNVISKSDASGTVDIVATYNETMDTAFTPTISFSPDIEFSGTLTFSSGAWSAASVTDDTYTATYNITDVGETQIGVDVDVSGGKDMAGNLQSPDPTTQADLTDVDTVAPTVVLSDNLTTSSVRDADIVQIMATFTEADQINDTVGYAPTISIADVSGAAMTESSNLVWTYDWDVPAGYDGNNTVTITATDRAGNTNDAATGKTVYMIDNLAPIVTSATINGFTTTTDDFIKGTGTITTDVIWDDFTAGLGYYSELNTASCQFSIDGGLTWDGTGMTWIPSPPGATIQGKCKKTGLVIADGTPYTLAIGISDNAGNIGYWADSLTYTGDTAAPITTFLGCDPGWHNTSQTVNLTCDDGTGSGCQNIKYSIDGATNITVGSTSVVLPTFTTDLNHEIVYYSKDYLSNSEIIQTSYCGIDTISPTIENVAIDPATPTNNSAPILTFTVNDTVSGINSSTITVQDGFHPTFYDGDGHLACVADGLNMSCTLTYSAPIFDFADGTYSFTINAQDLSGNSAIPDNSISGYIVDTTASMDSVIIQDGDGIINSAEAVAGVNIDVTTTGVEDGQIVSCNITDSGAGLITVTGPISTNAATIASGALSPTLADGLITATCLVYDVAGNNASNASTSTLDASLPAISVTSLGQNTGTEGPNTWSPSVNWDDSTICEYSYDDSTYFTVDCLNLGSDIPDPVSAGYSEGPNTLYIHGTDSVLNLGMANSPSFTWDQILPTGTVGLSTNPVYEGNLVQVVTVNFDETMDNSSIPLISFTGTSSQSSALDGAWDLANTTWTETFNIADNDEEISVQVDGMFGAKDLAGNMEGPDVPANFTLDTLAPTVASIMIGDGNGIINSAEAAAGVNIEVTTTGAEDGQTASCDINDTGAGYVGPVSGIISSNATTINSTDLTSLADGTLTVTCTVADLAGNTAGSANTSILNTTAGTLSDVIVSPNSGTAKIGDAISVLLTAGGAEDDLSLAGACTINSVDVSGSFINNLDGTYNLTYNVGEVDASVTSGSLTISCVLQNSLFNPTIASAFTDSNTLAIDANSPVATLNTPADGNSTNQTSINFTADMSDDMGLANATLNIYYSLGGIFNQTFIDLGGALSGTIGIVVDLVEGVYSWFYQLFDLAGNSAVSANNTITRDTINPGIVLLSPDDNLWTNDNSTPLTWNATDNLAATPTSFVYLNGSNQGGYGCSNGTLCSVEYELADGTYTWYINVTDDAGNFNVSSTRTLNIDTVAPTITAVTTNHLNGSFKEGEDIYFYVTYDENVSVSSGTPHLTLNSGGTADYTGSGSGFKELEFLYTVSAGDNSLGLDYMATDSLDLAGATVQDASGNNANNNLPAVGTFADTYAILIDTTEPSLSLSLNSSTTSTLNITINASDAGSDLNGTCISSNGTVTGTTSINDSGLSCGISYEYNVTCYDNAGNNNTVTQEFSTSSCPSSGGGGGSAATTVTISLAELGDSYRNDLKNGDKVTFTTSDGNKHSATVIEIGADYVILTLASTPQNVTLTIDETEKFDLTGDGYYDLSVKLDSISGGNAGLTLKAIYEPMPLAPAVVTPPATPTTPTAPPSTPGVAPKPAQQPQITEKGASAKTWVVTAAVILILVIVIYVYLRKRKEKEFYAQEDEAEKLVREVKIMGSYEEHKKKHHHQKEEPAKKHKK